MKRLGLTVLALAGMAFAGPYDSWSNFREVSVNTTAGGANVATAQNNFPLLVRLTNASAATGANVLTGSLSTGGADVRFTDETGNVALSFEKETWSTGSATFWVKVPVVAGNATTKIRMYWGKAAQTAASSGTAVFDTANGYRAVYHMNGGTSKTELDATVMANDMAASDSVPGSVPGDTIGVIGTARVLAGDSTTPAGRQYFVAPGTAGKAELNWGTNNPHTISAWVYARDLHKVYNQYGHGSSVFNKGDKQYAIQAYGDTANRLWEGAVYANANNGWRQVKSTSKALTGAWYLITTTWSGGANGTNGTGKLYINGVLNNTASLAIGTGTASPNLPDMTYNLYIGANPTGGGTSAPAPGTTRDLADGTTSTPRFWNGYIDELHLARGARDSDYVKLSFETQKAGASAVTLGTSQTPPAPTAFTYAKDTVVYIVGIAASANSPTLVGFAPTSYTVSPTLPAGITLNATTGVIGGTATGSASAAASYVVKAMNATDTVSKTLRLSVVTLGTENYSTGWTSHKDLWLNTQSNGAAVAGSVKNFPVLVRLDAAFFGTSALPLASGADIRFTKANGTTRLSHQIESWNSTTKQGAVWVLVDSVLGNNGTQKIVMHWGNASALNLSSGPAVFDTANGYEGVWHMTGTADEADATVNGFTATSPILPVAGAGAVGPARVFDGTTQYLTVPGSASGRMNFSLEQNYTLSGWVNPAVITTTTGTGHKIVEKGDQQWTLATYGQDTKAWEITTKLNNGSATWAQATSDGTNGTLIVANPIIADTSIGKWVFISGTYTGAAVGGTMAESLYVNGVPVSYRAETISDLTASRTTTVQVHIGVMSGASPSGTLTRYWNGTLDEIRVQSRARSADWVKLEYANQRPAGQNLVSLTVPTSIANSANAMVAGGLGLNVKPMANGLVFSIQGAKSTSKASLNLVDMWGRTVFTGEFKNGQQLAWNGVSSNGQDVSAGIYVARVTVIDVQTNSRKVMEHKVPFTR